MTDEPSAPRPPHACSTSGAPGRVGDTDERGAREVGERLRALVESGALTVAAPGRGRTAERHAVLVELGRTESVAVARLAEGHIDAAAILAEAGLAPAPGALYGVWASQAPGFDDVAFDEERGELRGVKRFCSGLGIVDRALVTVEGTRRRRLLVDVAARGDGVQGSIEAWATSALVATRTGDASFGGQRVDAIVGAPDWYLDRPGFWHGACGPAACWAGGAIGLVERAVPAMSVDVDGQADLGAMLVSAWAMRSVLADAGRQIDADPLDVVAARARALAVRHTVERCCAVVLDHFAQGSGPRPLAFDRDVAQRYADVLLYVRQHRGWRDLRSVGAGAVPEALRVLVGGGRGASR